MSTLLILGAGGFVGSHLVEHLVERQEHQVFGIDQTDAKLSGILGRNFRFVAGDISQSEILEDLLPKADVIVDLVAYANPSVYVSRPLDVFNLNFTVNMRVVDACIRHRKRLIQYSSAEVYGKASNGRVFDEEESDHVLGPVQKQRWIYAAAKSLLERVIHAHGLSGDLEYTILRPFNFIGPRLDYMVPAGTTAGPRVFAHFLSALIGGGPIYLVDGGKVHRSFTDIRDANAAFQCVLDRAEAAHGRIFNVGNPANNTTIRDLADLMKRLFQEITGRLARSDLIEISGSEFYGIGYEDGDRLPPKIDRLRALGWSPQYELMETFRNAMTYYLQGRGFEELPVSR
jgi:nucleoside-diphosphate-sugar epimerase